MRRPAGDVVDVEHSVMDVEVIGSAASQGVEVWGRKGRPGSRAGAFAASISGYLAVGAM